MLSVHGLMRPDLHPYGFGPCDLNLEAGDIAVLSGPSGVGKTLLLRAIADLDPSAGDVSIMGVRREDMTAPDWRKRVGYLASETGWWADRVGDHFDCPTDRVIPLLGIVGLDNDCLDWDVLRLSSGERHRLGFIRLLIHKPDVLLLDEPTGPLDPARAQAVESLIAKQADRGAAILLTSHDGEQAGRLGARKFLFDANGLREAE